MFTKILQGGDNVSFSSCDNEGSGGDGHFLTISDSYCGSYGNCADGGGCGSGVIVDHSGSSSCGSPEQQLDLSFDNHWKSTSSVPYSR